MKSAHLTNINLLNVDNFSTTTVGKVLTWALSIGRYIVVFTELIVILSFLSRFKLDRDLTDLNEQITQQEAIIKSYGDLEVRFKLVQSKTDIVKSLLPPVEHRTLIEDIQTRIPPDVKASKILVSPDSVQMSLESLSLEGFNAAIKLLQSSRYIEEITLGSVENTQNNQVTFDIKLDLMQ